MRVSYDWLKTMIDIPEDPKTLSDEYIRTGTEVEAIDTVGESFDHVVTAQVLTKTPHPDSDHMYVCSVDVGDKNLDADGNPAPLQIVCGAPNVAAGQKVPVALVGSSLPDGTVIKKAKLRGAPSFGMICSERELGLTEDHSGIMVLPENAPAGARLVDVLDLDREVLDISITPNRADCLSVLGLAREAALAFNLPLTIPDLPLHLDADGPEAVVPIEIAAPELCWLYSGRVISEIKVAPSPMRVRHRLHAVGVRPISNIVDVTNYILFECGQPLHSFDLDKLRGGRIVVKPAREGEKFVTLDGQERVLTGRDLCIRDAERPVGLAGVMGGLNTEITDQSRNVFLESAVFRPGTIRKTSRRLGLSSEASYRFERGIDQQRTVWALDLSLIHI